MPPQSNEKELTTKGELINSDADLERLSLDSLRKVRAFQHHVTLHKNLNTQMRPSGSKSFHPSLIPTSSSLLSALLLGLVAHLNLGTQLLLQLLAYRCCWCALQTC